MSRPIIHPDGRELLLHHLRLPVQMEAIARRVFAQADLTSDALLILADAYGDASERVTDHAYLHQTFRQMRRLFAEAAPAYANRPLPGGAA